MEAASSGEGKAGSSRKTLAGFRNIGRLRAFRSLGDLKLYLIALLQALIALGCNRTVVHKNIGTAVTSDEAITFGVVEPFNRAFQTFHFPPPRART
jgi:hypothetical protein